MSADHISEPVTNGPWLKLSQLAELAGGRLDGNDEDIGGLSTDTRTLKPGMLFIALSGERHDGHLFVGQAGMTAAMVSRSVSASIPKILVEDTLEALGRLGRRWREQMTFPVVALTGSNGKTTVKEMIASILSRKGKTLATQGNLNNHIGVPLTLSRLRAEHDFAVIEMGANHPGEIAYLTGLAQPDVAMITNAGPAHLEGFGSIQGVIKAKGEIFRGIRPGGTAIINADDLACPQWLEMAKAHRIVRFGFSQDAEVRGLAYDAGELRLATAQGELSVKLPLAGRHNAVNALGATAAALAAGADLAAVKAGLESMQPVRGRLAPRPCRGGAKLIDDSYNANPGSMSAAIEYLASLPGQRWLVMGDMGELGEDAESMHARMGALARERGLDRLYTFGPLSQAAAKAFGSTARTADTIEALASCVLADLAPDVVVLVKASRSTRLERLVDALRLDAPARAAQEA